MSVRYIFNTQGQYVAFASSDNLFSPDANWLGVIRHGKVVYNPDGSYLGHLTEDDRVITAPHLAQLPILAPLPPLPPFPPLRPFNRLRMPSLPAGYQDVFSDGRAPLSHQDLSALNSLLDSELVANDGTFLGKVTKNRFDKDSLRNQFGNYGNRYSPKSIFNQYSPYGSRYSALSPFNQYSTTPPRFVKNGMALSYLTANRFLKPGVHPEKFQAWLNQL
ncbi:MAG: hypothetical protein Q8R01_04830 [Ramlibacter sp.]|nr:hypothetical protein [Ramlibacter sp.]